MIGKIAVGTALWAALQFSVYDTASEQGKAVLVQAEQVQQHELDASCAQAKAFGLDDLQRAGLVIACN